MARLELEGAARRVDNSIAGNATTYTYAVRWSPIEDVGFRGNKTKSIRAPSITELFLPPSTAGSFANDPCDKNFVDQGAVPATRERTAPRHSRVFPVVTTRRPFNPTSSMRLPSARLRVTRT